ncbi:Retinoid isomerohydrolase [Teratosphaeria destructans]|uniref:Retinoid isomerohydrolase n=1 Tax=Teratosphaeria destructans TaxID=418781 RepID=A0A9W7SHL6_9PEZI|nr:Retinoid isomerohydrolase [Teratosphaeria destructans]
MKSNLEAEVRVAPGGRIGVRESDRMSVPSESTHYKAWPNSAGFNACGDHRIPLHLSISGHFPSYVAGRLYRTGPGGYKVPRKDAAGTFAASHWFDGFTTVHKFDLVAGRDECSSIWYSSYSQVDELIESARASGRLEGITFGQKRDPCDSLYKKFKTMFEPVLAGIPDSMNIGVTLRSALPTEKARSDASGRQIMTLTTDTHQSKVFDANTLEPLGVAEQAHLHPALTGPISAAHAATDPTTGDIFNFNLAFGAKQTYCVFRASPDGEVQILAEISGLDIHGAYIHSLFVTPNFVILCIWPLYFRKRGIDVLWQRKFDRRNKFTSSAFFCFHTTNAWEEAGEDDQVDIICELVQFKNANILQKFYYENLVSDERKTTSYQARGIDTTESLTRYKLRGVPLGEASNTRATRPASATAEMVMSAPAGDLPSINPAFKMKPHRYVWSVIDRGLSSFIDGLAKTDTVTGMSEIWDHPGHTPGEPIFVPRPNATEEDAGVVLTVVLNGDTGSSYLLCLDARTMKEMGRAELGHAVGLGFHGVHVTH